MIDIDINDLGYSIIGAAMEVRNQMGPHLLESFYEAALCHELSLMGINSQQQVLLPAMYKGVQIKDSFRMDIVVENKVIIECKSKRQISSADLLQLNTYLRLSNKKLGYLINFSAANFKPGIWTKDNPDPTLGIFRMINKAAD